MFKGIPKPILLMGIGLIVCFVLALMLPFVNMAQHPATGTDQLGTPDVLRNLMQTGPFFSSFLLPGIGLGLLLIGIFVPTVPFRLGIIILGAVMFGYFELYDTMGAIINHALFG